MNNLLPKSILCGLLLLLGGTISTPACQVPVFRYALERWSADTYRAFVIHRGPLEGAAAQALEQLQETTSCNLQIEVHDLDQLSDADAWNLPALPADAALPQIRLYYPAREAVAEQPFWTGALTSENTRRIVGSPARRELLRRLCAGDSAVWLLLSSAPESVNIEAQLKQATRDRSLPEGVLSRERFVREGSNGLGDNPVDLDDVLRSDIPLRISFSLLEVDAQDPAEAIFRAMLLQLHPALQHSKEPLLFPVFGRGRCMDPLPLSRMNPDTLGAATDYICGACSCQVKAENPGRDLLMQADWSALLGNDLIVQDRSLPPLAGAGDFVEKETTEKPPSTRSPIYGMRSVRITAMILIGGMLLATIVLACRRSPF